jgi:hypothetical protein
MKKTIVAMMIAAALAATAYRAWAVTRAQLYQQFGPRLLEAVALVVADELTRLRENPTTVYPEITGQQIMNAVSNKLETLPPFPWGG